MSRRSAAAGERRIACCPKGCPPCLAARPSELHRRHPLSLRQASGYAWLVVRTRSQRVRQLCGFPIRGIVLCLLAGVLWGACATPTNRKGPIKSRSHLLTGSWIESDLTSLASLADKHGVAVEDLEELNALDRRDPLVAGQVVFVPRSAKSAQSGPKPSAPVNGQNGSGEKAVPRVPKRFIWPVKTGRLSSRFGMRGGRPHEGIDIAAAAGTPVLAAAAGEVIYSGSGVRGYGNLIIVRHQSKLVTVYAHNRRNLVKRGVRVEQGKTIAEVGKTGRATGDHLHFEIRQGEHPLDPLRHLPAKP